MVLPASREWAERLDDLKGPRPHKWRRNLRCACVWELDELMLAATQRIAELLEARLSTQRDCKVLDVPAIGKPVARCVAALGDL